MGRYLELVQSVAFIFVVATFVTGCSGSGDSPMLMPMAEKPAELIEIGAASDNSAVLVTECANALDAAKVGTARVARYPKSAGVFRGWPSYHPNRPYDYKSPLQLRSDRVGGFIASHYTDLFGGMFRISANGDKSALPLPYSSVFDVADDGRIWFISDSSLSVGTQDGKVMNLAMVGSVNPSLDGSLGSSPLGPVKLIAAGRDTIYLLIEDGSVNLNNSPVTSTITRSLRVLSRTIPGQDQWSVRTVPLFSDLQGIDVISAMRVGPSDELVILLNQPFKRLVSEEEVWPGAKQLNYSGLASVRVMNTAGSWSTLASKDFSMTVSPNYTHGYLTYNYSLDARDLSVSPSGAVWVGGSGAIYSVSQTNGWALVASPFQLPTDAVGQDGHPAIATFASASQIVSDGSNLTFYDGETCQVRQLKESGFVTLSGPKLAGINFAGAQFVGLDKAGDLLFAYGDGLTSANQTIVGRYNYLFGLAKAKLDDEGFSPTKVKSLAGLVGAATCIAGTSYWVLTSCTGAPQKSGALAGVWIGQSDFGLLSRVGLGIFSNMDSGDAAAIGSTINWPGILNGDAPSGPSGVHVDGKFMYLFGWTRTDPPVQFPVTYHELRLYRFDVTTRVAAPLAGATIASAEFGGRKVDLSRIIPTTGGGPAFVQHRSDGKFWLCNGKELWILDNVGQLKRVAGLSSSVVGVDGVGDAASFAMISSIRVLSDNRLLVVDQGAHAIRLVTDDGKVSTIVGSLNQAGQTMGSLPAKLDTPIDAYMIGRDIYIITNTSRRVLRANNPL